MTGFDTGCQQLQPDHGRLAATAASDRTFAGAALAGGYQGDRTFPGRRRGPFCAASSMLGVEPLRAGLERNLRAPQDYAFPLRERTRRRAGALLRQLLQLAPDPRSTSTTSPIRAPPRWPASSCAHSARSSSTSTPSARSRAPSGPRRGTRTCPTTASTGRRPRASTSRSTRCRRRWRCASSGAPTAGAACSTRGCSSTGADFNTGRRPRWRRSRTSTPHPEDYEILAWDLAPGDVIAFDFRILHGTTAGRVEGRRRALSTRWLGDDVTYCRRPGETSPPFPDIGLEDGEPMREDWFPVVWRKAVNARRGSSRGALQLYQRR